MSVMSKEADCLTGIMRPSTSNTKKNNAFFTRLPLLVPSDQQVLLVDRVPLGVRAAGRLNLTSSALGMMTSSSQMVSWVLVIKLCLINQSALQVFVHHIVQGTGKGSLLQSLFTPKVGNRVLSREALGLPRARRRLRASQQGSYHKVGPAGPPWCRGPGCTYQQQTLGLCHLC